jgi:spore coat polysaccharide biosynthesis predicted glycosyltransferase SpsG
VDGGKTWGISMGHLIRSLLVANHLKRLSKVIYVMKDFPDGVKYVLEAGFEVLGIEKNKDSDRTIIDICDQIKPKAVIFDLIRLPYIDLFIYTREKGIQTIVFDSLGNCTCSPDVIVNDTIVPDFIRYPGVPSNTKLYLGPQYFLMEPGVHRSDPNPTVSNIMLTMGGSDPAGLTVMILNHLAKVIKGICLNVVLGPAFSDYKQVESACKDVTNIRVHHKPSNFFELLAHQDIIVAAGGRTLYECAYYGKPVVIVPSIEHEAATAAEFEKVVGYKNAGTWNAEETPTFILEAIELFRQNFNKRKGIFDTATKLVDGEGIKRVLPLFA